MDRTATHLLQQTPLAGALAARDAESPRAPLRRRGAVLKRSWPLAPPEGRPCPTEFTLRCVMSVSGLPSPRYWGQYLLVGICASRRTAPSALWSDVRRRKPDESTSRSQLRRGSGGERRHSRLRWRRGIEGLRRDTLLKSAFVARIARSRWAACNVHPEADGPRGCHGRALQTPRRWWARICRGGVPSAALPHGARMLRSAPPASTLNGTTVSDGPAPLLTSVRMVSSLYDSSTANKLICEVSNCEPSHCECSGLDSAAALDYDSRYRSGGMVMSIEQSTRSWRVFVHPSIGRCSAS